MDKAFTWAKEQLSVLEKWCCCDYGKTFAVAKAIESTASYMRTACSAYVDCTDYSKATVDIIHRRAEAECNANSTYGQKLPQKIADVEKMLKEGCE